MATLSKMIIFSGCTLRHRFHLISSHSKSWQIENGRVTKELEQLMKHMSIKIQELTSNVAITKKNEKKNMLTMAKYTRDLMDIFHVNLPLVSMVLLMN